MTETQDNKSKNEQESYLEGVYGTLRDQLQIQEGILIELKVLNSRFREYEKTVLLGIIGFLLVKLFS